MAADLPAARPLPTGTVTFAFCDIEGSTHLLQRLGATYADVLATYYRLVQAANAASGGVTFGHEGDGLFFVFEDAAGALAGALAAQQAIAAERWPGGVDLRVRMGIHTGDVTLTTMGTYVGLPLHQVARICAAAHGGQVVVSETTRDRAAAALPAGSTLVDLGHHRLKDLPDPLHLFQLAHASLPREFPRLRSDAVAGNLPRQLSSFVGRSAEVADACAALRRGASLVTLTGTGGAGKTRLALEVAAEVVDDYAHGAWLVELAAFADESSVHTAIAAALELREEPGRSLPESLVDFLHDRRVLLVLDNCEHLVGEVAAVTASIVSACAGVQVLATSQEALGLPGEVVLAVPPLDAADARALFADRAALHRPGFVVDATNEDAVAQICRRLDGIPLAIELAAARVTVLTPAQIAARLDDQFRLLTGGSRAALPRQRTLRATVEWSHDLLGDEERTLFRRLAVFAGGWTLEAAEAVCAGGGLDAADVFDLLARLASRSLVVVSEQDMAARYRLLEPIRQFATEKLLDAGEAAEARTRHCTWFYRFVVAAEPELTGADQAQWLAALEVDYDDVRAAMGWAAGGGAGADVLLEMAASLWRFWLVRGHWSEGRAWLDRALTAGFGVNNERIPLGIDSKTRLASLRARALAAAGDLATEQGEYDEARPLLEECLAVWQELGEPEGIAKALNHLGNLARARFEYDAARAYLTDALAIRRSTGNDRGVAVSLRNLGLLAALQRDVDAARALYLEALPLARAVGDRRIVATLTAPLATVLFTDGEQDEARRMAEEGLAIAHALGDRGLTAEHMTVLAGMVAAEGDDAASVSLCDEALALWRALGVRDSIARFHTTLGELAAAAGRLGPALDHLHAALDKWRRLGDRTAVARTACHAGQCAVLLGRLDDAEALLREAEELSVSTGDDSERAAALSGLADVARHRGDLAYAHRLYEQSLDLGRATGWKRLLWGPTAGLGAVARLRGDRAEALALLGQSLALRPSVGRRLGTAACLDEAAAALADGGRFDDAARAAGAAAALRERAGVDVPPVRADEHAALLARLEAELGGEAFTLALKAGRELSVDDAAASIPGFGVNNERIP